MCSVVGAAGSTLVLLHQVHLLPHEFIRFIRTIINAAPNLDLQASNPSSAVIVSPTIIGLPGHLRAIVGVTQYHQRITIYIDGFDVRRSFINCSYPRML